MATMSPHPENFRARQALQPHPSENRGTNEKSDDDSQMRSRLENFDILAFLDDPALSGKFPRDRKPLSKMNCADILEPATEPRNEWLYVSLDLKLTFCNQLYCFFLCMRSSKQQNSEQTFRGTRPAILRFTCTTSCEEFPLCPH